MDAKTTGIVAYITWIGLVIAFVLGDREGAKFHLIKRWVIWAGGAAELHSMYRLAVGHFLLHLRGDGLHLRCQWRGEGVPLLGQIRFAEVKEKGPRAARPFAVYREEILCREVL